MPQFPLETYRAGSWAGSPDIWVLVLVQPLLLWEPLLWASVSVDWFRNLKHTPALRAALTQVVLHQLLYKFERNPESGEKSNLYWAPSVYQAFCIRLLCDPPNQAESWLLR